MRAWALGVTGLLMVAAGLAGVAVGNGAAPQTVTATVVDPCGYPFQGQSWDANEPARTLELVGDSVLGQAGPVAMALGGQRCHTVDVFAKSGAAPCDFLADYGPRTLATHPSRVAFAFVGNATTPCMTAPFGRTRPPATLTQAQQDAIVYQYEVSLRELVRWNLAHNIRTDLVLPPAMGAGTWHGQVNAELVAMLTRVADAYGGVLTSAGPRDALTPGGVYRELVTVNGAARKLRHTDRTHLAAPVGTWTYAQAVLTDLVLDP